MAATRPLLIANPSPVPPCRRAMLLSTCENGRNSKSCCARRNADAGVRDAELERERRSRARRRPRSARRIETWTVPCSVNFTALATRFTTTCRSRSASPTIRAGTSASIVHSSSSDFGARLRREQIEAARDRFAQVERLPLERHRARLDLREIENVVDDHQQVLSALADRLGVFALRRIERACPAAGWSCRSRRSSACGSRGSSWQETPTSPGSRLRPECFACSSSIACARSSAVRVSSCRSRSRACRTTALERLRSDSIAMPVIEM